VSTPSLPADEYQRLARVAVSELPGWAVDRLGGRDDAIQEAWVEILGALPRYRPGRDCTLEGWLVLSARLALTRRAAESGVVRVPQREAATPRGVVFRHVRSLTARDRRIEPKHRGVYARLNDPANVCHIEPTPAEVVAIAIRRLPGGVRHALILRHGLCGNPPHSLTAISKILGCSRRLVATAIKEGEAAVRAAVGRTRGL
jgi:DNA-directed RNA polymerase specialized sigma24 family protein